MSRERAASLATALLVLICAMGVVADAAHADEQPPPPPPPPREFPPPAPPVPAPAPDAPVAPAPAPMDLREALPAPPPPTARPLERTRTWKLEPNCDPCRPACYRWTVTLAGTYSLLEDPSGPVGVPLGVPNQLQWGGNDYDGEFGGFAKFGYAWDNRQQTVLRGRYVGSYSGSSAQTGVFGSSPGPVTSPVINATLSSEADLWGVDVMHWRAFQCCCRHRLLWGLGATFQRFDEQAAFAGTGGAAGAAPLAVSASSSVENSLYGAQLGAAWLYDVTRCTEFGLRARGLVGAVNRDISVRDTNVLSGGNHSAQSSQTGFGWGGEVEVSITHYFASRVGLTAGYNLIILGDIVRAHDAMDFTQGGTGVVQARHKTDMLLTHQFFVGAVFKL